MKRMLSLVMVLVLVLSLGTVAFADEEVWNGTYTVTESTTFNIKKTYNIENDVTVNETLTFTSTPDENNPDYETDTDGSVKNTVANLTVGQLQVSSMAKNKTSDKYEADLTVTIPSLSKAGTYEWTIKETAGNTAGVTYDATSEIHVTVLVVYDNDSHVLKIENTTSYIKKENDKKADTFTNTFKSGSFTVAKDVDGNMANETDKFEINVTLSSTNPVRTKIEVCGQDVETTEWEEVKDEDGKVTGYTYTKKLEICEKDGAQTFANIPVGVTVTVAEDTDTEKMNGYTYAGTSVDSSEAKKTNDKLDTSVTFTIEDTTSSAIVVKNTNSTSVETGISMDTLPYVLLLAVACVGIIALVSKKRLAREH